MYRLGVFAQALAIAYVASFIFYYVTVHIPAQRRKVAAQRYIAFACSRIVALWRGLAYRFQRSAEGFGTEPIPTPNEETIVDWFDKMFEDNASKNNKAARFPDNLPEDLMRRKVEIIRITDELLGLYIYEIDHDLFEILTDVKSSRLLDDVDLLQYSIHMGTMSLHAGIFAEYSAIMRRLMNHQGITK